MIFENLSFNFAKNLCDEFSKIKNLSHTFSSFFRADHHELLFICHIKSYLVEKWPRKWAIL